MPQKNGMLKSETKPPRFSGDFVWKFIGAFFASAIMWTEKVGILLRYGAALLTILFITPVLSGDFRLVWRDAPLVALMYLALVTVILAQSAAKKVSQPDSYFYSTFGEYIFNRKQYEEREKWAEERANAGDEKWNKQIAQLEERLNQSEMKKRNLQRQLKQVAEKYESSVHLAAQVRAEVHLYEVILHGDPSVNPDLLMERLLKELDLACLAVACYRSEKEGLSLLGSAGAEFVAFFDQKQDQGCPEVESWTTGADIVSQNDAYPYEYMVTTVLQRKLFVLVFRLDMTDLGKATSMLYDIIVENKHLLMIVSRILNTSQQQFPMKGSVAR